MKQPKPTELTVTEPCLYITTSGKTEHLEKGTQLIIPDEITVEQAIELVGSGRAYASKLEE